MTDYDTAADLYRAQGEANDQAAIDERRDAVGETKEEYEERVYNVPGLFAEIGSATALLTGDTNLTFNAGGDPPQPDPEALAVLDPDDERTQFYSGYPELSAISKEEPADEEPVPQPTEAESDEDYDARVAAVSAAYFAGRPLAPGGEEEAEVAPTGADPDEVVQPSADETAPTVEAEEPTPQQPDVEVPEEDETEEEDVPEEAPEEPAPVEPEEPAETPEETTEKVGAADLIAQVKASEDVDFVKAQVEDDRVTVAAAANARLQELESNV